MLTGSIMQIFGQSKQGIAKENLVEGSGFVSWSFRFLRSYKKTNKLFFEWKETKHVSF